MNIFSEKNADLLLTYKISDYTINLIKKKSLYNLLYNFNTNLYSYLVWEEVHTVFYITDWVYIEKLSLTVLSSLFFLYSLSVFFVLRSNICIIEAMKSLALREIVTEVFSLKWSTFY